MNHVELPRVAFVLAAGLGTRMRSVSSSVPKPLLQVAGRTLLDHAIDRVVEMGIQRVVVNVHYHAEQIRAALARRSDVDVAISEEAKLLETGGGAKAALPLLGNGPFLALNSDVVWTGSRPLAPLFQQWSTNDAEIMLLLAPPQKVVTYAGGGDFALDEDGAVRRAQAEAGAFIYTGAQILRPEVLAGTPEGAWSFNWLWDKAIDADKVRGVVLEDGEWIDAGFPEGLRCAQMESTLQVRDGDLRKS